MECCKSREQQLTPPLVPICKDPEDKSMTTTSTNSQFSDFVFSWESCENKHIDACSLEIEEKVKKLLKEREWVTFMESAECSIRTLDNSEIQLALQNSELSVGAPVVLGFFSLERAINACSIIQALLEPRIRMSWDSTIKSFDMIGSYCLEGMTIKICKKFPLRNKEFIVRAAVSSIENTTCVIIYSQGQNSTTGKSSQGQILFWVLKIVETHSQVFITCIQQIDLNSGRQFSALAASDLFQWMSIFRKFLSGLPQVQS